MPNKKYDFSGYATKNDIQCSDGRIIRHNAFKDCDGMTVPLVWNHDHNNASNVIGHCDLQNRDDGVYAYASFNHSEMACEAKELVEHGDVRSLSIYANKLKQKGNDVIHGMIREVSLVLAGANPGALIDNVSITHSDNPEDVEIEAKIYFSQDIELSHNDEGGNEVNEKETKVTTEENKATEEINHSDEKNDTSTAKETGGAAENNSDLQHAEENKQTKTIKEVYDSMTEEQRTCCHALIGLALEQQKEEQTAKHSNMEENEMARNIFDQSKVEEKNELTHSDLNTIVAGANKAGYATLADAMENELNTLKHSITDINNLYPEHKPVGAPETIKREPEGWVADVIGAVHKTPFSRVKSWAFNLTADEARAKGYVKGNQKAEEVIVALKRTTDPQTVYKLQKLDRDDVVDITDFDVVAYIKEEMGMMLNEEIARAILVGDGRSSDSNDKIDPLKIRPILGDSSVYTINKAITRAANTKDETFAKEFIRTVKMNKKEYKGSGSPVMYMNQDLLAACLCIEDTNGRFIYNDEASLAKALRVSRIVEVPVMDNVVRTADGYDFKCVAIMVNLKDYNLGKGPKADGFFDDFNLDYNKLEYLKETRVSGALVKPYSAMTFEQKTEHAE